MIVLHFSMQGEDVIEHANDKDHLFTFLVCKRSILMSNVFYVHFRQLVDHCVT
jgi:hypothetical protein